MLDNNLALKRWFALLVFTACLCLLYMNSPILLLSVLAGSSSGMLQAANDVHSNRMKISGPTNILYQIDNCIDPAMLNRIFAYFNLSKIPVLPLDDHFMKCLLERNYVLEQPKQINFGVLPEYWNQLKFIIAAIEMKKFSSQQCTLTLNGDCAIGRCESFTVRLTKINRTPDFYSVPSCDSANSEILQLIPQMKQNKFIAHSSITLFMPFDMILYHELLRVSKFVECNITMADQFFKKHPHLASQNKSQIVQNFEWIVSIRNLLYSLRMTPMLAGGSLLGWRRECGVISFTHDFDFAVPIEQYNAGVEDLLKSHKTIRLKYKFGKPSDSLEYTLMDQYGTRADIFFLYQEQNYSWVGGLGIGKQKIKYMYPPLTEICSTYLLGYLFHVPCNSDEFIEADYGANWVEPNKNYRWYKYGANNGLWNAKEWPDVFVKYY